MRSLRSYVPITLIAGMALWPAMAAGAGVKGTCHPTKTKFSASLLINDTTSADPVHIPDSNIEFVQGGTGPSCVIIEFSATAHAGNNDVLKVRALLDDTTSGGLPPNDNGQQFATGDGIYGARRMINVLFPSVSPGAHKIKMYYWSVNGGKVVLNFPWTIIHYSE